MTFSILNETTNIVISTSNFRLAGEPTSPNFKIDPLTAPEVVTSCHPPSDYLKDKEESPAVTKDEPPNTSTSSTKHKMPILESNDVVRRTFVISQEDSQRLRARIIKAMHDYNGKFQRDSTILKLIFSEKDDTVEDVFTYN